MNTVQKSQTINITLQSTVIKIVQMKIKEKKKKKKSTDLSLPKIKHDLIHMISKYQNKKFYLGKTRAILNTISAVNYIYV